MVNELMTAYAEGQGGRGTLDYLRIVSDPGQIASQFRSMLAEARAEYLEFSRPPYAVDPLDAEQVIQARARGVSCRLLVEHGTLDAAHERFLADYADGGRRGPADRKGPDEDGGDRRAAAACSRCWIR